MRPFYADDWLTVYQGDCRDVLPTLPAESVDCVVTSPPYWGLRDYGTATWAGGDEGCDHRSPTMREGRNEDRAKLAGSEATNGAQLLLAARTGCGKCGATRQDSQLGLESTPEEYVANLVAVFREVKRVLKPSGTCWLNLGDSYAGNDLGYSPDAPSNLAGSKQSTQPHAVKGIRGATGLRSKNLVGIPWRVAFALQADGWYLRSDIIWSKPNPMPESVTDRPTKSHEYLFLLTKSARYYFDADAVRETMIQAPHAPGNKTDNGRLTSSMGHLEEPDRVWGHPAGRNLRSVWTIATRPYADAHFAVFPTELPERCIKAGSSERGVCPNCGKPWTRIVERSTRFEGGSGKAGRTAEDANANGKWAGIQYGKNIKLGPVVTSTTTGWLPSCDCTPVGLSSPAVILDPFAGSGTVGLVANRLSRRAVLIDLNPAYLRQQMQRNAQTPLGLAGR